MIELGFSKRRGLLVSETAWGLQELDGLLKTLGGTAVASCEVLVRRVDPKLYLGAGKLEEFKVVVEAEKCDLVLFDFALSPTQYRNIEKVLGVMVLDRAGVILEIFNHHARTKEAKLQVELARLEYLMPRLTKLWSHFERQRGSGGGALKGKGMGEKQIEVDRRLLKDRMQLIRGRLKEVESARGLHRRHRQSMLKVALVGYTNAGKSTLLNALTHSEVLVEDALFATLDATVRLLNPKSRPAILGIDTVGFIDRLPHALVASFRSTLGEVLEADLLLHVVDASHAENRRHFDVTESVLRELGADQIPVMVVMNKIDLCKEPAMIRVWSASLARRGLAPVTTSALDASSVEHLRARVLEFFRSKMETIELVVPFDDGKTVAQIHQIGNIEKMHATEKGTFFRFRTMPEFASQFNLSRYRV